ncbi:hypothetical protein CDAR_566321 [Caerostris darwini]|uniref:Uncharacterized protein n=1 Tax=Caerostris darwini TaxID=1538125 RepID=A0AAV4UDG7_9ARAC|nr:hypothetical protein CDAR_566321 [Caerostris darwini]
MGGEAIHAFEISNRCFLSQNRNVRHRTRMRLSGPREWVGLSSHTMDSRIMHSGRGSEVKCAHSASTPSPSLILNGKREFENPFGNSVFSFSLVWDSAGSRKIQFVLDCSIWKR